LLLAQPFQINLQQTFFSFLHFQQFCDLLLNILHDTLGTQLSLNHG